MCLGRLLEVAIQYHRLTAKVCMYSTNHLRLAAWLSQTGCIQGEIKRGSNVAPGLLHHFRAPTVFMKLLASANLAEHSWLGNRHRERPRPGNCRCPCLIESSHTGFTLFLPNVGCIASSQLLLQSSSNCTLICI